MSDPRPEGQEIPARPVDASMSLLRDLLQAPVDPAYVQAAQRRREQEAAGVPTRRGRTRSSAVLAGALLGGLVLGTSIAGLRAPEPEAAMVRRQLQDRIEAGTHGVAARTRQVDELRDQIRALESQAAPTGADTSRIAAGELAAGLVAVSGPGLRITLDDAPEASTEAGGSQPRSQGFAPGRIVARDLQEVTNSLWALGAEAVAVNDQRLVGTSAIRVAGQAILVNYRPLTRPYVVTAIGPADLGRRFQEGSGGAYLHELASAYHASIRVESPGRLTLPAGTALTPRYARAHATSVEDTP